MIKLTLTPQTQPITYVFEKNCVTIGKISTTEILPDLALPSNELETIHVKIEYNGTHFVAFNLAEDPFVTVNERPFGKKILHSGDLLQIGSTQVHFEGIYPEEVGEDKPATREKDLLRNLIDKKIESIYHPPVKSEEPAAVPPPLELDLLMEGLEKELTKAPKESSAISSPLKLALPKEQTQPPTTNKRTKFTPHFSNQELDALLQEVSALEDLPNVAEDIPCPDDLQPTELLLAHTPLQELMPPESNLEDTPPFSVTLPPSPELPPLLAAPTSIAMVEHHSSPLKRKSIKDDLPNESEEENPASKKHHPFPQYAPPLAINWTPIISALGALSLLFAIVAGSFYLAITGHNEEEEIKAAQAVSDVAMALNFAQINHAQPQNQNWSDPDFLRNNLTAVLASSYSPLAEVDPHGHFLNTSYMLRIYTGSDLNHFLIIAQPSPGLMQWIAPKAAITVDSSLMELRKIADLKTLNRLLINATLDNSNSTDIANFVRLGELIPLVELKKFHPHTGFDLPKALAYIRPGAENLIYNGARYYPLGESLMKKAIKLLGSDDYSQDVPALVDEISRFTRFPNIVLYSSGGIKMAQRGQKALATFFPNYKFLHAYLQFNSQNFATNSHLLIDDSSEEPMLLAASELQQLQQLQMDEADQPLENDDLLLVEEPSKSVSSFKDTFDPSDLLYLEEVEQLATSIMKNQKISNTPLYSSLTNEVDQQLPLYNQMVALTEVREQILKQISEEIDEETSTSKWVKSNHLTALYEKYEKTATEQQEKIVRAISALQQEYTTMPLTLFMNYVKATGLRPYIQENLRRKLNDTNHSPFPEEFMNISIEKIRQSTTFSDLDKHLQDTSKLLTLENFPDPALFIAYQNRIHSTVLHKFNTFLLSPITPLSYKEFNPSNRHLVAQILQQAWVTDEDEFNYYLNEFDLLTK